ncbi:MAG: helix-turn-helix domain-containing protein [Phycisphaerales bacterium]
MAMDGSTDARALHDRMSSAASGKSYRWVARATGSHPETVRRYMQGQSPNIEFVTAFCSVFGLNPQWLLTGEGPMRRDEVHRYYLAESDPADLLAAIAATIDRLTDRIDRLELYCQQLETRLRVHEPADEKDRGGDGHPHDDGQRATGSVEPKPERAERIGRALSQRSHEDAD